MRTRQYVVLGLIALCTSAAPGIAGAETNQAPQLAVTLLDGSLVKGTALLSSIAIQTPYTKMELPLNLIRSFTIKSNHETALLILTNGDMLTGVLNLKPIGLNTVFGKVAIDLQYVAAVSIFKDYGANIPQDGLVLYYSFDKAEDDQIKDSSGKEHHGKANGAAWTSQGKLGGAYSFDGADDFITVPGYKGISGNKPWTVSLWFKRSNQNQAQQVFIGWGSWGRVPRGGIVDILLSGGELYDHYGALDHHTGVQINNTDWHHYVLTSGNGTQQRHLDGVSLNNPSSFTLAVFPDSDVTIGKRSPRNELYFEGLLDEVCIYDRALSSEEISMLYRHFN